MLNTRILRILITQEISIVLSVPEILLAEIKSLFYCERVNDFSFESPDITISIVDNLYVISTLYETIECHVDEYLFYLVTTIENLAVSKFDACVFHGSAVSCNSGKAIAFIGKSGSGKTTMMLNLINGLKCNSIADDLLFFSSDNMLSTVLLPYKIKPTSGYFQHSKNGKINLRKVSINTSNMTFPVSAIVSVNYDSLSGSETFCRQDFTHGFSLLIKNSRKAVNNKELAQTVAFLLQTVPVYKMHYSNTPFALKCISELFMLS